MFLIALAAVTAILVAVVPAMRETRTSLTGALSEQGTRASSSVAGTRLRELFIIGQAAIAVPLLLAGMATAQRFRELQRAEIGFDPQNVLVSQIVLPSRYDKAGRASFARELVRRIEALPGSNRPASRSATSSRMVRSRRRWPPIAFRSRSQRTFGGLPRTRSRRFACASSPAATSPTATFSILRLWRS